MKGLDGIQGPVYVGTGCCFNRQALYGYSPSNLPTLPKSSSSCSCCCRRKKPAKEKDLTEVHRDAKREDLNSAIFNLREIESEFSSTTTFPLFSTIILAIKLLSFLCLQIMTSMRDPCLSLRWVLRKHLACHPCLSSLRWWKMEEYLILSIHRYWLEKQFMLSAVVMRRRQHGEKK